MFGDDYKVKVPIEKIPTNSSFNGVFNFKIFIQHIFNFIQIYKIRHCYLQLESCPKWADSVHNSEALLFRKSSEYINMVSQISKRLGFLDNITDGKYNFL